MAEGLDIPDTALDLVFNVDERPPDPPVMKSGRSKRRSRPKKYVNSEDEEEEEPLGGLSMFFEHQELDQTYYPNQEHRRIKQEDEHVNVVESIHFDDDEEADEEASEPQVSVSGKPLTRSGRQRRSYRNVHTAGGRVAVSRPVSKDLNSDDEIIVSMKRKHISDRKIATYLRETGRVNYNPKTIGTRFMRIRTKLAEARDAQLDAGEITWTSKDDENLLLAVHGADKFVSIMKDAADNKKWDITSRELCKIDANAAYSARACKERYENIKSGNVVPTGLLAQLDTPAQHEVRRIEKILTYYSQKLVEVKKEALQEIEEAHSAASATNGRASHPSAPSDISSNGALPDGSWSPSRRAMDVDSDLTGLDTWMLRTIRMAEQDKSLQERLGGLKLPPPTDMTQLELHAELEARGLERSGKKERLVGLVQAARNGNQDLQKSILPADASRLRAMLEKRAGKETNGDDSEYRSTSHGSKRRRVTE